jgi:hypothetical protein
LFSSHAFKKSLYHRICAISFAHSSVSFSDAEDIVTVKKKKTSTKNATKAGITGPTNGAMMNKLKTKIRINFAFLFVASHHLVSPYFSKSDK